MNVTQHDIKVSFWGLPTHRHSERSEESFFRSFAAAQDDIIVNVTQHDINVNVARDDNEVLSAHVTLV